MKEYVYRTVNTTNCIAFDSVGEGEDHTIELVGTKMSPARLASRARKLYGPTYAVRDVRVVRTRYGMDVDEFMKNATVIEQEG